MKTKTTTTPSTPTTGSGQPTFATEQTEVIPEVLAMTSEVTAAASRFQVSPITEERPANLGFDPKGNHETAGFLKRLGMFCLKCKQTADFCEKQGMHFYK